MRFSCALAVLLLQILYAIFGRSEPLTDSTSNPTHLLATTSLPPITKEPRFRHLPSDNSTGCKALLFKDPSVLFFYSETCREVPRTYAFDVPTVAIKSTKIIAIRRIDFIGWNNVMSLAIDMNPDLTTISEGVFSVCSHLINLTISNNDKLTSLPDNVFKGLNDLRNLVLRKNGFQQLFVVATVARPNILPNLEHLDVSENTFTAIRKDDLLNLTGSKVRDFRMNLCSLVSIEPESLRFFSYLRSLSLSGNNLDVQNITGLIENLSKVAPQFRQLNIAANMLQTDPLELLPPISKTNISHLNLRETHFTFLDVSALPVMSQLVHLDLSAIKAISTPTEIFSHKQFPKLSRLVLAKDNYMGTTFTFELPNLKMLDLSSYSCDKFCDTSYQFKLDDFQLGGLVSLETLLLNNNGMYVLTSRRFKGLNNLNKLVLRHCSIYRIYPYAFLNLKKLKQLDLAYNSFSDTSSLAPVSFEGLNELKLLDLESCSINFLHSNLFDHLVQLETLNLRFNGIGHMDSSFFARLHNLRVIDLTYNSVHKWEKRVFENNPKLSQVALSNNLIEELTTSMLTDFQNVSHLSLHGNPLVCTCTEVRVVSAHNSIAIFNMLENEKSSPDPAYCNSPTPRLNVSYSEFILSAMYDNTCEFDETFNEAVVICAIVIPLILLLVVICYILRWHIKYWIFLLRQLLRCYYFPKNRNRKSGGVYRYDAFVSYSNEDRSFVVKLVSMLESQEPFFSLCVFERDFMVGGAITESVFECLSQSRRTILILSKAFVQSQWCQWELQLAQNKKLVFKDDTVDPLIIIKVGDIEEGQMTPSLRYLTKTRIYLQWNSDPIKQKLFWRRLRDALVRPEHITVGRCNPGFAQ